MTLYNYKRFLGDSDKIVQKYFNLKEEAKKKEIFRKIGLDKYFQPVTSVIRQEIKPFHNLIKKNEEEQGIDRGDEMDRGEMDRGEMDRGEMDRGEMDRGEMDRGETDKGETDIESLKTGNLDTILDDDEDRGEMDRGEMDRGEMDRGEMDRGEMDRGEMDRGEMDRGETDKGETDIESLKTGNLDTILDDDEDGGEMDKKFKENPYDELKNSKFNKNSENFANEWLEISKDLGYEKGQTNFDSFTNDDLIKYSCILKQIQASSSKRTSNEYIQYYDNDVKNQLKIINNIIGNEEVKENKKINEMFKQTKLSKGKAKKKGKGIGRGIKKGRGGENNSSLIYYNNPQQLIDRLRLLVGSKRAGNTNPEIDNEIIGISDELVKKGLIMNYDYTNFMNKNYIKF